MTDVYGIKNCGTVKNALSWLDEHRIAYTFHDYKKEGVDETRLRVWIAQLSWEALLNRKGTTWRKLPEAEREGIDEARAIHLMLTHTSIIKRPVIERGGKLLLGFDSEAYRRFFG